MTSSAFGKVNKDFGEKKVKFVKLVYEPILLFSKHNGALVRTLKTALRVNLHTRLDDGNDAAMYPNRALRGSFTDITSTVRRSLSAIMTLLAPH